MRVSSKVTGLRGCPWAPIIILASSFIAKRERSLPPLKPEIFSFQLFEQPRAIDKVPFNEACNAGIMRLYAPELLLHELSVLVNFSLCAVLQNYATRL